MNTSKFFKNMAMAGSPGYQANSQPIITRAFNAVAQAQNMSQDEIQRVFMAGWNGTNLDERALGLVNEIQRGIYTGMSAFPVRENLEAEAKILIPTETPLRNRLPRGIGAGLRAEWKLATSFGSAFGTVTTTSGTVNAASTIVVANAAGFYPGETILVNGATSYTITAVNESTKVITVAGGSPSLNSQTNGQSVVKTSLFQPGGGAASDFFFGESGAPSERTTEYDDASAAYKLGGEIGEVTIMAIATGANFQDQLAVEKRNRLMSTMLNEENALIHSKSNVVHAPWGDGITALGYRGLIEFIDNEAPASHVQSSVGALTHDFVASMITRLHYQGARGIYILVSGQESLSLNKIAFTSGNGRYTFNQTESTLGTRVAAVIHPITGEAVQLVFSSFLPPGTMIFCSEQLPDGSPAAEVDVLPQTNDFSLANGDPIQGYVAQEIAPDRDSPMVLPFLVSIISVPKWKSANVFAIARGITPAA